MHQQYGSSITRPFVNVGQSKGLAGSCIGYLGVMGFEIPVWKIVETRIWSAQDVHFDLALVDK